DEQQVEVEEAPVVVTVTLRLRQGHELVPVGIPGVEEGCCAQLREQEPELVGHAVETDGGDARAGLQEETVAERQQEAAGPGELIRHPETAEVAHYLPVEVDAGLANEPHCERATQDQAGDQGAKQNSRDSCLQYHDEQDVHR